jgi:MFS family permease
LTAALCAGLLAAGTPIILVAWLVSWVAAVGCATALFAGWAGRRVSAMVSVAFGAMALAPAVAARVSPGPSLAESAGLAAVLVVFIFVPCGVGLSCAISLGDALVARWLEGRRRKRADGVQEDGNVGEGRKGTR